MFRGKGKIMKDYKYVAKSLNKLKREIETSFSRIKTTPVQTQKNNTFIDKIKNLKLQQHKWLIPGLSAFLLIVLFFSFRNQIFARDNNRSSTSALSFIGNTMLQDEFQNMENPQAVGGPDLISYDENQPELKFFFYKVQEGENISKISKKLGLNMDTLVSLNSMDNAHTIQVGARILVPNVPGILYTVQKGDSLSRISDNYKINTNDILYANDKVDTTVIEGDILFLPGAKLSAKERAKAFGYLFTKPIRGRFTSSFGTRWHPIYKRKKFHTGIDIGAPYGSRIKSAKEGKVIYAGWKGGYGKVVIIKHQLGYETVYGHMSKISVSVGQYVNAGQIIGRVGSTGVSTGPHLHFEIRRYGQATNPLKYTGLGKSGGRWY